MSSTSTRVHQVASSRCGVEVFVGQADLRELEAPVAVLIPDRLVDDPGDLAGASRPVIVAGGGAISAEARAPRSTALAERLGAAVVTTWNGKGAIDEIHPLAALTIGDTASTSGNELAATADVLLSVGNRFTDWSASSWRRGVTFSIPPSRLIQCDIDPREIGKNYPVEVALVGDARATLIDLLAALGPAAADAATERPATSRRSTRRRAWLERVRSSGSAARPMTMARAVREIQRATREERSSSPAPASPQGMVKQRWVTRIRGRTSPRAASRRWASRCRRDRRGARRGPTARSSRSAATATSSSRCRSSRRRSSRTGRAIVLDNSGWISIKGGQQTSADRRRRLLTPDGSLYSPDFRGTARASASTPSA